MKNYKPKKTFRKGIAMIELIFALVIMGIVLLSAPMLIQQSIHSSNVALQQEAISAVSTHLEMILTMHWDENNSEYQRGVSPILKVNNSILDFNNGNLAGHKKGVMGRNTNVNGDIIVSSNILGKDINENNLLDFDDIDDFNNGNFGLKLFNNETTTADIGDYVDKDVNISTKVTYNEDRPNNGNFDYTNHQANINNTISIIRGIPTNIKFITTTLTSNSGVKELEKNITLKAFSCNIGTYAIYGKEFP
jgi:Tfp pilus assembly protein PilV